MEEQISKKPVITLKNVIYNYTDYDENGAEVLTQRGVNDLSLTVHEGEFLALVGPNGSGKSNISDAVPMPLAYDEPRIVIASTLTPSETVGMNRDKVLGFAVETGSTTSHTAILARSLKLPAVVGMPKELLDSLTVADKLIVDGFSGKVIVNPDAGTEEAYRLKLREAEKFYQQLSGESDLQAVTTDGFTIVIAGNVDAAEDYEEARQHGATHSTASMRPPMRSSSAVMASRVRFVPRTRSTPAVVLASICSVL